jgi:hypothetical protein
MNRALFLFLALASTARAVLPVTDTALIGVEQTNWIQNLLTQAKQLATETQTELNSLTTMENTVLQTARLGNPAALRSLPGVSNVAELEQIYGTVETDYQSIKNLTNPSGYQAGFNSILGQYQLPQLGNFVTVNGTTLAQPQSLFQFPVSNFNSANQTQSTIQQLNAQLKTLTQQLAVATTSLQNSTTASDTAKYTGAVNSLNGQIAAVNGAIASAKMTNELQLQKNQAAQQISTQATAQQQRQNEALAIDNEMGNLPTTNFRMNPSLPVQ